MNNFTVMTDAQLAAHDASTSKRYQAAAQEAQATIAKQATRIAALEADAARMDWIQKNLLCADWEYPQGEKNTQPVICISWPASVGISGNLRSSIDDAMKGGA